MEKGSRPRGLWRKLPDGSEVVLRSLEPDEADLVQGVFDQLGVLSRRRRFLVDKRSLTATDLRALTSVDHHHHEAIVAVSASDARPIGVIRLVRCVDEADTAEGAVAVVDSWQGRGLGTLLVSELVARARDLGVRRFSMLVARDNVATFRLLDRHLGDIQRINADGGVAEVVAAVPPAPG